MTGERWFERPYWGFDLETTGVDVERDRIVTATVTRVDPKTGEKNSHTWIADPGVEIPEGAAGVHGYTTERARAEGRPAREVVAKVVGRLQAAFALGGALVIYNAPFDLTMLDRECRRHLGHDLLNGTEFDTFPPIVVDPLVIDKRVNERVRGKGARKLINTCARWGVTLTEQDAHTSEGDVLAAMRLAWKQVATTPFLAQMPLEELHRMQGTFWFPGQQRDFAAWMRRQGNTEDAARIAGEADDWPMRLRPAVPDQREPEPAS